MISGYHHDVNEVCVCLGFCTLQNGSVESQKSIELATENSSVALVAISMKMMNVFHLKQLSKTNIQLPEWLILVLGIWAFQIFCVCLLQDLACKVEWLLSEKSLVESELRDVLAQKNDLDVQMKGTECRLKELESQLQEEKLNRLYQLLGMLLL